MEAIKYLLLAESNEASIMNALCKTLGVSSCADAYLVAQSEDYLLHFCIASKQSEYETACFFERQLNYIYDYFSGVETGYSLVKTRALRQLELSDSLVLMQYSCREENQGLAERRLDTIAKALLAQFCGLLLSDSGHKLLNENLSLVFSDEGAFKVMDFAPCKVK